MEVTGFRSAFFIDTASRLLSPGGQSRRLAWWTKVLLLCANIPLAAGTCNDGARCNSVLLCTVIFVIRVMFQMTWFWSRGIPWKEVVFEAGCVIPISIISMAKGAAAKTSHIDSSGFWGLLVFLLGTWLNLYPEWQRHVWKRQSCHQGRLYTEGLFSLARHINYTGEILSFVGFSLVTGASWTMWVPAAMALGMCTLSIREIEFYLSQRYKEDWPSYVKAVPWLMIPGIF